MKQANTSSHRPSKAVYATGMTGMGAMVISGIAGTISTDRIVARVEKTVGKGVVHRSRSLFQKSTESRDNSGAG